MAEKEAYKPTYEKRKAILKEYNLDENDLLAPGMPGVGIDQIALLRTPIVPGSSILDPQICTDGATDSQ
jgi:hypothetical protein